MCRKSSKVNALQQVVDSPPAATKSAEEEVKDTYNVTLFAIDVVDADVPDGVQESPISHSTDILAVDASGASDASDLVVDIPDTDYTGGSVNKKKKKRKQKKRRKIR